MIIAGLVLAIVASCKLFSGRCVGPVGEDAGRKTEEVAYDEVQIEIVRQEDVKVGPRDREPLPFDVLVEKLEPMKQQSTESSVRVDPFEFENDPVETSYNHNHAVESFASVLRDDRYVRGVDTAAPLRENEAAQLRKTGVEFVGRYLVPETLYPDKAMTKEEARMLSAAGLKILSVFESYEDRAASGTYGGTQDGRTAYELATEMGIPCGSTIYFAVDYDAQPSEYEVIRDYFKAVISQLHGEYRVGIYGGYYILTDFMKDNICDCYWQACAWSTKSNFYDTDGEYQKAVYLVNGEVNVFQATTNEYIGVGLPDRDVCIDQNVCLDMDAAGLWSISED